MSGASSHLKPLVSHIYTADPSAHVFNNRVYIYPSHDRETDIEDNDNGDQYDMADYHVLSMDHIGGEVTDHGVVLKQEDIPWVSKQLWAPDAAYNNGKYYLYFPARDKEGVFRIGVAVGDKPEGPFVPDPEPIAESYSIDPACLVDDDGQAYLYFGGLWGGQLQCWQTGEYKAEAYSDMEPKGTVPAIRPRVAKLSDDMRSFVGGIQEAGIVDEKGELIIADDHDRSPLGPFTYAGRILEPVEGWTTHHSIAEVHGKWYLFHHDTSLSGKNHLRCVKVRELVYDAEGKLHLAD
ncbi:hypothetical protein TWF703_006130 [Orbilia oligospora]|uniref:Uncharacterized protein n=1 Tax=Orbilia oligospora TaxID=2813651 RepID=A0A7C8JRM0_ORBOL|nr:hypothetical protein TWF703_006130 [Orbilia oligospora]